MIRKIKKTIKTGPRPPIALLTDFGANSPYPGIIKGVICRIHPRARIIDLCHGVTPGDIEEAGFLLSRSYSFFPDKTVFCVVVDPGVGSKRRPLLVKTDRYYFIGPDNGVLSIAAYTDGIREIIELTNRDLFLNPVSNTFQGRDIFAPVSAYLARGKKLNIFGKPVSTIKKVSLPGIRLISDTLRGTVIYIDTFGNLVTNIEKKVLSRFLQGKGFSARLNRKNIQSLIDNYSAGEDNSPFFIQGSFGLLEISLKNSSAAGFFNAVKGNEIIIRRAKH